MFLVPTSRRTGVSRCRNEIDQLFSSVFGSTPLGEQWLSSSTLPSLNVWEDDECLFVEVAVPGFKEDDLDISVVDNELTIKGQRDEVEQEGRIYHHHERGQRSFTRTFALPVDIDADRVAASLNHGVLLLELAKSEAAKPRTIAIKAQE